MGNSEKTDNADEAILGRVYVFLAFIVIVGLGFLFGSSPLAVFLFILPYIGLLLLIIGLFNKLNALKKEIQEIRQKFDTLE